MKSKTAIVTGASRGIGKAIANSLAKDGYNLILNCRKNSDLLKEYAITLKNKYGISYSLVIGDISKPETSSEIAKAVTQFGSADVLVHSAGISKVAPILDLSENEWHQVIDTNLSSCFYLAKKITPYMLSQKSGKILFISSVWGEHGASCEVAYSASKGGVNSFTKALAKELAPSAISVNALACGMIDTDMNSEFSQEDINAIIDEIPAGKIATPQEVGEMAALILKAPSYLTGQIITFDGGWQ